MTWVKRRAAEIIFLSSLETKIESGVKIVKTGKEKVADDDDQIGSMAFLLDKSKFKAEAEPVRLFLDQVGRHASIAVTLASKYGDERDGTGEYADDAHGVTWAVLPESFDSNPFLHVEFLDPDFLNDSNLEKIVSMPVEDIFEDPSSAEYSKYFATVNMFDNFGSNFDGSSNPVVDARIQINGQDRFSKREGGYFNYVQPFQHWPNTPSDGVNSYSFALKPAEYQPSGTLNFSRVDNSCLLINRDAKEHSAMLAYYSVNYNILRILGGMGGLAYSN
jgi:hypothetical protein